MLILGHPDIPYEPLYYVESVEEIAHTPPNATLWLGAFGESVPIARHCMAHGVAYAVMAESLADALKANALRARYILAAEPLAARVQKAADTYLFDAKVLLPITEESEMERAAEAGIDGVIFQNAITFPESS
jgi:NAD(P)H-dependent flavin oxidoreductase YrpB (nitropropane dioxygenase family)